MHKPKSSLFSAVRLFITLLLGLCGWLALPAQAAFTINGDNTVTDSSTGLIWDRCAKELTGSDCTGGTALWLTWSDALTEAQDANSAAYLGHQDWRLPNLKELESLVKISSANPAIDGTAFPATWRWFWSSTQSAGDSSLAWSVDFGLGVSYYDFKVNRNQVRLVRGGQSFASFDSLAPAVSSISPSSGTTAGGTSVTITGTNLIGASAVTVGGNACTPLSASTATAVTCSTTAGGAGTASVLVTTTSGTNAANTLYTYVAPSYSVSYDGNSHSGGSVPTDAGAYVNGATVTVLANTGSLVKTGYLFSGWNTAANGSGTAQAALSSFVMGSAAVTLYAQWVLTPTVAVISPSSGSTLGGTVVTVTGTGFVSGATVKIGTVAASNVTWLSATAITATTPAGTAGAKNVLVTNPDAQASTLASGYTYLASQAITGFAPASPVVLGAAPLTLTATGGASGSPVVFASTSASSICTVSGASVTFVDAGVCNLTANQGSGGNYSAAPQVTASISITAVNGSCASVAATAFMPTSGLCTTGTASTVANASPWAWTCIGAGSGHTNASCTSANQTIPVSLGAGRAVVASTNNWTLDSANSAGFIAATGHAKSPPTSPTSVSFPHGLLDLRLITGTANSAATVTINYPVALPAGTVYWKYGPTASNPAAHWYQFSGAVISADRLSITLTMIDNADGDDAYTTDGLIVDPGGPGVPVAVVAPVPVVPVVPAPVPPAAAVQSIPTLSEWGVILLSGLLALFGLVQVRRRS